MTEAAHDAPPAPEPLVKVARDLTAIEDLYALLGGQLAHKASDRLMPGGLAMVELGPDARPDEWAELIAAAELRHFTTCPRSNHKDCVIAGAEHVEDQDDDWEPILQTLLFWSEDWRRRNDAAYEGHRLTVGTEIRIIRELLTWAWDHETRFDDFTRDIHRARRRLEDVLHAGIRSERGVPCMYDECRGARLVRKVVPTRNPDGSKGWRHSKWHCPKCKRTWDEDAYWRNVKAANERAKTEVIDGVVWAAADYAAQIVARPEVTIRVWIHRLEVESLCILAGRRSRFVKLDDVQARDALARERAEKRRQRTTTV